MQDTQAAMIAPREIGSTNAIINLQAHETTIVDLIERLELINKSSQLNGQAVQFHLSTHARLVIVNALKKAGTEIHDMKQKESSNILDAFDRRDALGYENKRFKVALDSKNNMIDKERETVDSLVKQIKKLERKIKRLQSE